MKRYRVPALIVAAAIVGACTQVSSDPNAIVALAFDSLPYPAIVAGDTLRDESGVVQELRAAALNADGLDVPTAALSYLVLDTGVTVSASGIVASTNTTTTAVRILAQAGTLQSRPLTLIVTPRPDSIALDGTVDTLKLDLPDKSTNTTGAIAIKVLSTATATAAPARGWIVRYSVEYHGVEVPANSTTLAWLVDDNNRRSAEDTTGADGRAARRLRVISTAVGDFGDSLTVIARAIVRGTDLAGAPVRTVIRVVPR